MSKQETMFSKLKNIVGESILPITVKYGADWASLTTGFYQGVQHYRLKILQDNDWTRIEYYYEDGTFETTFEK